MLVPERRASPHQLRVEATPGAGGNPGQPSSAYRWRRTATAAKNAQRQGRCACCAIPGTPEAAEPRLAIQTKEGLEGLCISEATELQEPAQNELPAEPDVPFATFASTGLEANFEAIARLHMAALSANEVPTPKRTQQLVDPGGGSGRCGLPAASGSCGPACAWNLDVV